MFGCLSWNFHFCYQVLFLKEFLDDVEENKRKPSQHQDFKLNYGVSFIAEKNDEMNLQVRSSSPFSQKYRAIFKLPIWRTVTCDGLLPIKAPRRPVSVSLIGNIREKMMIL